MNKLTLLRRWTWELPQSLLGAILIPFYNKKRLRTISYGNQEVYIYDGFPGGISLGYYTLVDYNRTDWDLNIGRMKLSQSIKHESGHGVQSKWSGPFYLIIFGLPSAIHNLICRYKESRNLPYNYYSFWVEKLADKLGGVER